MLIRTVTTFILNTLSSVQHFHIYDLEIAVPGLKIAQGH